MKFKVGDIVKFITNRKGNLPKYNYEIVNKLGNEKYNCSGRSCFIKNRAEIVEIIDDTYLCTYEDDLGRMITLGFEENVLELLISVKPINMKDIDNMLALFDEL